MRLWKRLVLVLALVISDAHALRRTTRTTTTRRDAIATAATSLAPPLAAAAPPLAAVPPRLARAALPADVLHDQDDATNLDDFVSTPSGLRYLVVATGNGAYPAAGNTVAVHYTGWLDDFGDGLQPGPSEKKFDSSYDRRSPITFAAGTGRVIKGWDESVLAMRIGEKRRVIIPPSLGYGDKGAGGGLIPPGATLYFDIELIRIL